MVFAEGEEEPPPEVVGDSGDAWCQTAPGSRSGQGLLRLLQGLLGRR